MRFERRTTVPSSPGGVTPGFPSASHRFGTRDHKRGHRNRQTPGTYSRVHYYGPSSGSHRRRLGRTIVQLLQARSKIPRRPRSAQSCYPGRQARFWLMDGQCRRSTDFLSGHPRFFLGSDSAPHPVVRKSTASPTQPCAAGVYTSPVLLPLVAHLLESFDALDKLSGFVSSNGRAFYKVDDQNLPMIALQKEPSAIAESLSLQNENVAPFWAGKTLDWTVIA